MFNTQFTSHKKCKYKKLRQLKKTDYNSNDRYD